MARAAVKDEIETVATAAAKATVKERMVEEKSRGRRGKRIGRRRTRRRWQIIIGEHSGIRKWQRG